ncbi:MAG: SDR family oxidoreductase [Chloroflexi bacterium]|nr:SDR family oxidoreductase [Chloroflexota bacterium]
MNLLITGVSGLLGANLAWEALRAGHAVRGLTGHRDLPGAPFPVRAADLTDPAALDAAWAWARPDAVIHTAALADLDACERDPDQAHRLNAWVPGAIARRAAQEGVPLVHISTDAVFDGQRGDYTEDDPPNPLSVYARTKLEGERAVLDAHPQAVVARVNFFGWSLSGTRSLAEWFFNNLRFGQTVRGFTDVFFCPLLANHLARLLLEMLERGLHGLYHATSPRCLSKYAFGVALAEQFGYDPGLIRPASVDEAGLTAPRARRLTLRSDKLAHALGHPLPDWQAGIVEFHRQYTTGYTEALRSWLISPLEDARYDYCAI